MMIHGWQGGDARRFTGYEAKSVLQNLSIEHGFL